MILPPTIVLTFATSTCVSTAYPPVHAGHDAGPGPESLLEDGFVLPAPGLLEAFEETDAIDGHCTAP
jgi:hypothetical protein